MIQPPSGVNERPASSYGLLPGRIGLSGASGERASETEAVRMSDWVAKWQAGGEAGDARASVQALTADAELISPLTDQFSFRGRKVIEELLAEVFKVYSQFHYTDEVRGDGRAVLVATAQLNGRELTEIQHLTLAPDGRISTVTLAMRPLPAVTALQHTLGPRLARKYNRPGVARILAMAGGALDKMAASGDSRFTPLADPGHRH